MKLYFKIPQGLKAEVDKELSESKKMFQNGKLQL